MLLKKVKYKSLSQNSVQYQKKKKNCFTQCWHFGKRLLWLQIFSIFFFFQWNITQQLKRNEEYLSDSNTKVKHCVVVYSDHM